MLQKMRGKVEVGKPFQLANQAYIADSGDKISMAFESNADGYFYLWNEGKSTAGEIEYYPLFPRDDMRGGSSQASGGELIETKRNTFNGETGIEAFYLVWSKEQQKDLENAWQSRPRDKDNIQNADDIATLVLFQKRYEVDKPRGNADDHLRMRIKSNKDVVVYKFTVAQTPR